MKLKTDVKDLLNQRQHFIDQESRKETKLIEAKNEVLCVKRVLKEIEQKYDNFVKSSKVQMRK